MRTAVPAIPVVGIGASAGGLDALERFFRNVPVPSGLAFVVVQHLDPTHKALLAELLQHVTSMPVTQVRSRTRVKADSVYVIPPNKELTLEGGALHLHDPVAQRGHRLPIDVFFASLALNSAEHGVGVVLSGMGHDGTAGMRAIKEHAGAAFVQEPTTAKFAAMPSSVIAAGLADMIAPPEELPALIVAHLARAPGARTTRPALTVVGRLTGLDRILVVLRERTGHDFSLYKQSTIHRRIERRMALHHIDALDAYERFIQATPDEVHSLFKELLIGVTNFFRDPDTWNQLSQEIVPALIDARPVGTAVRCWVVGTATGEEAYSLAITLAEVMEKRTAHPHAVKIFATDLDGAAIEKARAGIYPPTIAADVSPERLHRWFSDAPPGYQVAKRIREMVIFAQHNVIMDPPFTRVDLVSCRNLLIYLTEPLQQQILQLFHYALNPGGTLVLGSSETIGAATHLFAPIDGPSRIYRRLDVVAPAVPHLVAFTPPVIASKASAGVSTRQHYSLQGDVERLLLAQFAPVAVLTNRKGDIIFVSGDTSPYLRSVSGSSAWNVFAMSSDGMRDAISEGFREALLAASPVTRVHRDSAEAHAVNIRVQAVREPLSLKGTLLVAFTDDSVSPGPQRATRVTAAAKTRIADLEAQLNAGRLEIQTHREHTQSTNEEASAANEELQSTNEELQSTNEELTTSKEEMQSMNEELQTLNRELETRVDDLSRLTNDMKNLIDSTEIAIVFLDLHLHIRLFTAGSTKMFRLIPGDIGRPLTDLASLVIYADLASDAREVLRTLVATQRESETLDRRWCLVRIMPYRTLDNRIDGVTITFSDITASKALEEALRTTQAGLEQRIVVQDQQLQDTSGTAGRPVERAT